MNTKRRRHITVPFTSVDGWTFDKGTEGTPFVRLVFDGKASYTVAVPVSFLQDVIAKKGAVYIVPVSTGSVNL